ncbi:MAG TPA: hypothetical protein VGI39_04895 [Polyangiaceae bacterium]
MTERDSNGLEQVEWCLRTKRGKFAPIDPCTGSTQVSSTTPTIPRSPCPICGRPIRTELLPPER